MPIMIIVIFFGVVITGAFVGMACQDGSGTARPADFDFFEYRERDYCANAFSAPME